MINEDRQLIIEEELLLLRDAGEIPEVALHNSLEYLCNDPEGPCMVLNDVEREALYGAVRDRYLTIILRDLCPENRGQQQYRGVERARVNWKRLQGFCNQVGLDNTECAAVVAKATITFIKQECCDRRKGVTSNAFNCNPSDLLEFLATLRVTPQQLPADWQQLCLPPLNIRQGHQEGDSREEQEQ